MNNQTASDQNLQEPQELFPSGSDDKISNGAAPQGHAEHSGCDVAIPADGQHSGNCALAADDWRDIARRIEKEPDSKVMMDLIQQLIAKLDAKSMQRKPPTNGE